MDKGQPTSQVASIDYPRRRFLKAGLMGTALLGLAGVGTLFSGRVTKQGSDLRVGGREVSWYFLTADEQTLLMALMPAILAGAIPEQPEEYTDTLEATLAAVDEAIHRFSPANQAEFRQLFDLLNFAPTRVLAAGVWQSWEDVEQSQVELFLQRWRHSRFSLFNNAYNALVKVTNVAFYGKPANWGLSGYPGPPAYALAGLPQFQQPRASLPALPPRQP